MAKTHKNFLLAGLSGLLLALAYPGWNFDAGILAWIGFIPLIFALQKTELGPGWIKRFFLTGFFAGLVYFLIVFRWFWSFYPLDTLGITNRVASVAIILPIYLLTTAVAAAFWGLFGLFFGYFKNRSDLVFRKWDWLIAPAIFVILEYLRVIAYGLVWFGPGTLFGAHWTIGNPAYMLVGNRTILELSSYLGIYGVAFLILVIDFIILKAILSNNQKNFKIVFTAGLLLLVTFTNQATTKNTETNGSQKNKL